MGLTERQILAPPRGAARGRRSSSAASGPRPSRSSRPRPSARSCRSAGSAASSSTGSRNSGTSHAVRGGHPRDRARADRGRRAGRRPAHPDPARPARQARARAGPATTTRTASIPRCSAFRTVDVSDDRLTETTDDPLVRYADRRVHPDDGGGHERSTRHADEPLVRPRGDAMVVVLAACSSSGTSNAPSAAASAAPQCGSQCGECRAEQRRPERGRQGRGPDRLGQLLRVEAHGRALRPGPRARRLHGRPANLGLGSRQDARPGLRRGARSTSCPSTSAPASATTTRPWSPATARPTGPPSRPSVRQGDSLATVLAIAPGPGQQRRRRPRRTPRPSLNLTKMSDLAAVQDKLKWGLPPDCDKNPLCKGALESYGIKYPPKVSARPSPRATRRSPRPSRARPSTSPGCARPSRPSRSSASSSSRTTRRPSRPRTSPRSSATTTWRRSTRPPSRRSSTPSRPR